MFIDEIIKRKLFLTKKLADIDNYLYKLVSMDINDKSSFYNQALDTKFKLLNKIRSHKVLIQEQNFSNKVEVLGNSLSVYDAVMLRDTLLAKLLTLDKLILDGDLEVINIFSLIDQRDALFEEYIIFDNAIRCSDATTLWEKQ